MLGLGLFINDELSTDQYHIHTMVVYLSFTFQNFHNDTCELGIKVLKFVVQFGYSNCQLWRQNIMCFVFLGTNLNYWTFSIVYVVNEFE